MEQHCEWGQKLQREWKPTLRTFGHLSVNYTVVISLCTLDLRQGLSQLALSHLLSGVESSNRVKGRQMRLLSMWYPFRYFQALQRSKCYASPTFFRKHAYWARISVGRTTRKKSDRYKFNQLWQQLNALQQNFQDTKLVPAHQDNQGTKNTRVRYDKANVERILSMLSGIGDLRVFACLEVVENLLVDLSM